MVDTIVINLDFSQFKIIGGNFFEPRVNRYFLEQPFIKAVNNPPAPEQKRDYKPRMTLFKRPYMCGVLRIEFSAPKIIFGNNLDEIEKKDFEKFLSELIRKMKERGVKTTKKVLRKSSVVNFHPSKNIELSGYTTSTMVIRDLEKVGISKRFDQDKKDFRNNGHSLQYYNNSHALVFYDKVADMAKSKATAIDKENTLLQKSLFGQIKELRKLTDIEVTKMEVRLTKKRKINSVLKNLGFEEDPTLEDVFKKDFCQKILLDYWEEMILKNNSFIFMNKQSVEKDMTELSLFAKENRKSKNEALVLFALKILGKEIGLPMTRQILEESFGQNAWSRIPERLRGLDSVAKENFGKFQKSYVKDIEKALNEFKPIKKEQFNDAFKLVNF